MNHAVTPIQKINESLNGNQFYIKRDDLYPLSFGGNKARKATYFLKDMLEKKATCIVTYGSSSSNHCRVIANLAAMYNLSCYIVSPTENNIDTVNSRLVEVFNAQKIYCSVNEVKVTIKNVISELETKGETVYFIPGGGHGNLGTQAYVEVFNEILNYEQENHQKFDYIFHTTGTGTTQAGLVCGKLLSNSNHKVIGISNARKGDYGRNVVLESVNSYLEEQQIQKVTSNEIDFIDDYILDGYGSYNEEILKTINSFLILNGIPLDKTYTGKAYWGMLEFIKQKNIHHKNVLFIHTGGTPLFFDDLEEIRR